MSARFIPVLCGAAAVAFATGFAPAATILLDDPFTDGGRTDGADPYDSNWYLYANTTPSATVVDGKLVATGVNSTTGFNPGFHAAFPTHTLATGETITLSFDFSSQGSDGGTNIRFGLYDQAGTNFTGDIGVPGSNANPGATFQNDVGYSVFAPHKVTGTVQLYSREATNTGTPIPISAARNFAIAGASTALATPTNSTDIYNASLSLTRTLTGYDYAVAYATASFTGSTTTLTSTTFNSLTIWGINANGQSFTIDNVNVSVIPEPASLSLLALSGAAALRRRRR